MREKVQIMLFLTLLGCTEKFDINIPFEEQDGILVVDGRITDQDGPYTIRLSRSKFIQSDSATQVETGATIIIEEENGSSIALVESQPGTYFSNQGELKGEIGKRYRLSLRLANGLEYQSSWELIRETPEIDELRMEFQTKGEAGLQLYINTQDESGESSFFRWEIDETWKYEAPIVSNVIYLGNDVTAQKPPEDVHKICWKNSTTSDILTKSVNDLSESVISNHPFAFIRSDSARFNIRYTALVKQFVLGLKEYDFWNNLRNTNQNVGSLYDNQPFQVIGNIKNINSDEVVLGYFSAYSVKEVRIYINREEFPARFLPKPEFSDCAIISYRKACPTVPGPACFERTEAQIIDLVEVGGQIFHSLHTDLGGWNFTPRFCGDCETYGGSTTPPTFWEE